MLILAAAPLGNPADASLRLREQIAEVPYIAAEDSRKFSRLCSDLGVRHQAQVISFFEGNEIERLPELVEILRTGKDLLVITDAGLPGVSDPGYRLVRAALEEGIKIQVLPGPSAVTTALLLSGLPSDRFAFEGFLPRTQGARLSSLEKLQSEERALIFFEAPHRLVETLADMSQIFGGQRTGAICREMTKTYEETVRGTIAELLHWAESKEIKGEITVVVAGFDPSSQLFTEADFVRMVLEVESAGISRKEAIAQVSRESGVAKRLIFDAMVNYKNSAK